MKKWIYIIGVVTLLLAACGGSSGSSGGGSQVQPGNLSFSESAINVTQGSDRELILQLNNSSGISGLEVAITSSESSVATISPAVCVLSSPPGSPSSCEIIVHGVADGVANITANANGYQSVIAIVDVINQIQPGKLSFSKSLESVVVESNNHVTLSLDKSSGVNNLVVMINSSNPGIASTTPSSCTLSSGINRSCELTINGNGLGNANLTATASPNYESAMIVNVVPGPVIYGNIAFNNTAVKVSNGGDIDVILTLSSSSNVVNDIVNLSSSNSSVATIDKSSCNLSSTLANRSCTIKITAPGTGSAQLTATSSYNGHSYNITPVGITVASSAGMSFSATVESFSETIYNTRTYSSRFIFTNNSTSAVSLGNTIITPIAPLIWQLGVDGCSNKIIAAGASCSISASVSIATAETAANLTFVLQNTNGTSYTYSMPIYAVAYKSGYAPLRVMTPNDVDSNVYLVATVGGVPDYPQAVPILYTKSGLVYIGSVQANAVSSLTSYSLIVPKGGLTLYTPVMLNHGLNAGGRFYVSYESALNAATGSNPNTVQSVPYLYFEYNVPNVSTVYTDMSYVDATSVPIAMSAVDISGNLNQEMGIKPEYYNYPGSTIISNMKESMSIYTGVYNLAAYFPTNDAGQQLAVYSPSTVFTQPNFIPTGFESAAWNTYTQDLWNYYKQPDHNVMINANEIADQLGGNGCYLQGHVENDNLMHFTPYPDASHCPTGLYVAGGAAFNSGANSFTMQESNFNYYGFYSAFADQTIYGVNGSYQSMLKYLAGAQAAGFLPFCQSAGGSSNFIYGHGVLAAYSSQFFQPNYSCLSNYASYGQSVINQYDKQVHTYFNSYGYGYDDSIGIDGTVTSNGEVFPLTVRVLKFN